MPLNVDKLSTGSLVVNGTETNNGTAHYELDITQTNVVEVNTTKGIIDIIGMDSYVPTTGFSNPVNFVINNTNLDLTIGNRDNVYVQYSVYYSKGFNDAAIPYLISTGFSQGLEFTLYNAGTLDEGSNWTGALYVYFELYTIN